MKAALQLDDHLLAQVQRLDRPLEESVSELIVCELYRRDALTSGKAAALLHMERIVFIRYAARLGLSFFEMTASEWQKEVEGLADL